MTQPAYVKTNIKTNVKIKRKKNNESNILFFLSLPFIVFVFAFHYVPLFGWIFAFMKYIPGVPILENRFVGLENFIFILNDYNIPRVLRNTLVMSFLGIICSFLPVVLAIMLNEIRSSKFRRIIQTTTTLPNFISWIIVYSLAFSMFSTEGAVNSILSVLHISDSPVNVLGNGDMIWYFMEALFLWKGLGWSAIIYLATIASIDSELYEAAKIDGANRFKSILYITIPGIMPTFVVLLLLRISSLLNTGLDQYLMFYNSLVADNIEVLDYYLYRVGIVMADYSYGTAVGMLKSIIAIILLFTVNAIAKRVRGNSIV
jgi:putative aldouronate transport system permease protein